VLGRSLPGLGDAGQQRGHWLDQGIGTTPLARAHARPLTDHFVGLQQQRFRHRQAERPGGFEVRDQFELPAAAPGALPGPRPSESCPRRSRSKALTTLERLLRYCTSPPFALERLEQGHDDYLIYRLPKPHPDGRTELRLAPLKLIDHLGTLIPPRAHPPLSL
jgi:hypothetical protein